ncbi:MAG: hypothetical protein ACPG05_03215 [Bdellovibrionales bacterium]
MNNDQNNIEALQNNMRDLLGFVRMENAVLMDQGYLSLRGLYLQKMVMLKDLEEQAEDLAQENSDKDIAECIRLLSKVQKELKVNAFQHLEAIKSNASNASSDEYGELLLQQDNFKGGTA